MADEPKKKPAVPAPRPSPEDLEGQQWAIQRRVEDVFTKLGEKFGDLTGRVEVKLPGTGAPPGGEGNPIMASQLPGAHVRRKGFRESLTRQDPEGYALSGEALAAMQAVDPSRIEWRAARHRRLKRFLLERSPTWRTSSSPTSA